MSGNTVFIKSSTLWLKFFESWCESLSPPGGFGSHTLDMCPLPPPLPTPVLPPVQRLCSWMLWCSCDVLILLWFLFFCFSLVPLLLGNEIVALVQQEAVGRREACLGEEFMLLFPAEVQSQGRACTGSVTWAPAPCPILIPGCSMGNGLLGMSCQSFEGKSWALVLDWALLAAVFDFFFPPFFSLLPKLGSAGSPGGSWQECHGHHHCWGLAEVPATPSGICSHSLLPCWKRRWWCSGIFPLSGPRVEKL